nr:uncharacterized protein LOC109752860 [Aegilops tauschii subsp. strangulata]
MVTAWDPSVLSLSASSASRYTLTASLSSTRCALSFRFTNVYAPSDHAFTADFVEDLMSVAAGITGPWLVLGDFNLIRFPHEKNNNRFDASRAAVFNSLVNSLALHELALLDRLFTWTNRRDPPTLARLDHVFFDHAWDVAFPDSCLSSRRRPTSDHVPLVVEAATRIPSSSRFFFENSWLRDPQFLPSTLPSWSNTGAGRCAVGCLAARKKRFRAAAKVWKRLHKFIPAFDNNCRFVIDLLDFWEECRPLSSDEHQLRKDARMALAASIRRQSAYWKQRGKCRAVCEGDENTGFFHASASHRRRANTIRVLDVDGAMVLDHAGKAGALLTFYSELLGRARPAVWRFDLEALYRHAPRVDAAALVAPFSPSEIKEAVNLLDRTSAPGPDGLGPAFYQAAWSAVAGDLQRLFDAVHDSTADLDAINRAYIDLLPKGVGVPTPGAFRPKQIGGIIDVDQSGFLAGRSISENFVYAAEVIQCCHKRGAPALVFKLDFAKAFDSVNWGALRRILMARGFPRRWCDWMDLIFESSRSAVLLNGVPGRWFTVRRGLRQDDQSRWGHVPPSRRWQAPLVLQYADDTLVILRADSGAAARLRRILDDFAAATGLDINFDKSTLVPMHVPEEVLVETVGALGYAVQGFPQAYLGLPLSWEKLCFADFLPMIAKVDRYLAGWRARLLSPAGRLVLINAVLDALPIYAMAAMLLPPAVIKELDSLRRAFLWNAAERASGAQCLVAWERVCRTKAEGGLGVRDLATQNRCLLLKMLHRLHATSSSSRWPMWVWAELDGRSLLSPTASRSAGEHGKALARLLPLYRGITRVTVSDGRRTSFWLDSWLPCGPLAVALPVLHSHTTMKEATVWRVRVRAAWTVCWCPGLPLPAPWSGLPFWP